MAALLRANHPPIDPNTYPHSILSLRLQQDVIESQLKLQMRLSRMAAIAVLHSHPASDPEEGLKRVNTLYENALSAIPYFGGAIGSPTVSDTDADRMAAIEAFRQMNMPRKG